MMMMMMMGAVMRVFTIPEDILRFWMKGCVSITANDDRWRYEFP